MANRPLRCALVSFAALGLLTTPSSAAAAPRLAVLSPSAPWSPECQRTGWRNDEKLAERCTVLETLADEARAGALAALERHDVDVMTRENTAELLKTMGATCTEGECEVETAKLIGADYVVSGNVALVEGTWFVTYKLHTIRTAKLVSTAKVRGRSQVEIIEATSAATRELVARGAAMLAEPVVRGPREVAPSPPTATTLDASTPGMVRLHGGTFAMGGRTITVAPFALDVTEVTVAAYTGCVSTGKCSAQGLSCSGFANYGKADRATHPINCVDWVQASAYCASVGKRLPTEEEWEWAARGAERGTTYPWGNHAPREQLCWNGRGSDRQWYYSCSVGAYPTGDSPHGVHDLSGNVSEWTSYADGERRVYRGGGWANANPAVFAASYRFVVGRTHKDDDIGLRCAKSQ
jgi:formylglycine-generating enzyme required for sulfatase activity